MRRFLSTSGAAELAAGFTAFAITRSPWVGLGIGLGTFALRVWVRRPAWTRLTSADAIIANLDDRIDSTDPEDLPLVVDRARREAGRTRPSDPDQRYRVHLAAAWASLRILGHEQSQQDLEALLGSLTQAPPDAVRYTVGLLLQLDRATVPAPWTAPTPRYALADRAWADRPAARATLARAYARELGERGELELGVALLREALEPSRSRQGTITYRRSPSACDDDAWALSVELAELLTREGHLGEAWSVVEDRTDHDPVREIQAATFRYNAGFPLDACVCLLEASRRVEGSTRRAALTQLVGLLEDVEAREAAAAFRRALGDEAPPPPPIGSESDARAHVTEALAQYGGDHPFVSDALLTMAHAQLRAGRSAAALASVLQARTIAEAHCGSDDPQLIKLLELESLVESAERSRAAHARIERLRRLHRFDEIEALRP